MIPTLNDDASADPARVDVRDIPCRVKHAKILQRWSELPVGAHFVLINDHDPVPLHYQLSAQHPDEFTWEYLMKGPEQFHIRIRRVSGTPGPSSVLNEENAPGAGISPHEAPARS